MPRKNIIDPQTNLTSRQKTLLFALIKEYCDLGQGVGSKDLKEKFGFTFSSATIRNELAKLRDLGYVYQPFVNSSSKPTEKAFKIFIEQLILGLQITSKQQQELKRQILEMEQKQARLSKEISRLVALSTGGVGFSLNQQEENITGITNLLAHPGEGKVADILEFLDNIDSYKPLLLSGQVKESDQVKSDSTPKLKTFIGEQNPILPLGRGYAMVTTEVYLADQEKAVVGLITPVRLLAKKKNLELLEALSRVLGKQKSED
jgi:transcriptional regulator of heat shock response